MVAMQIARDPLVRQCVRQTFYERATLKIKPTKKGKKVKKKIAVAFKHFRDLVLILLFISTLRHKSNALKPRHFNDHICLFVFLIKW